MLNFQALSSLLVLNSQNYMDGHALLKSTHPKKYLPNFPTPKNPRIENFKPKKILRSPSLLEIWSTSLGSQYMCLAEFSGYLLWLLLQILLNNRLEWKHFFLSYLSKMKSCHYSRLIIPPRKTLHIGLLSHWRLWSVSSYLSNKKIIAVIFTEHIKRYKIWFCLLNWLRKLC